jgi:hypothetical protein
MSAPDVWRDQVPWSMKPRCLFAPNAALPSSPHVSWTSTKMRTNVSCRIPSAPNSSRFSSPVPTGIYARPPKSSTTFARANVAVGGVCREAHRVPRGTSVPYFGAGTPAFVQSGSALMWSVGIDPLAHAASLSGQGVSVCALVAITHRGTKPAHTDARQSVHQLCPAVRAFARSPDCCARLATGPLSGDHIPRAFRKHRSLQRLKRPQNVRRKRYPAACERDGCHGPCHGHPRLEPAF